MIADCNANGDTGCVSTTTFRSADITNVAAGNIKSGITIAGVAGSVIESPADCSTAGQRSCVATGTYKAGTVCNANGSGCYLPSYVLTSQPLKAIDHDHISANASKYRTSMTIAAVPGTLADCVANNTSGCVTVSPYVSADLTNLSAGNVKNGVTIAGVTGLYPSSSYKLPSNGGAAGLNNTDFNAQMRSSTAFEYWTESGTYQTGAGDADVTATNISSGVDVFGVVGMNSLTVPDPWDIRAGTVINGVTGKLKINCRNTANASLYNQTDDVSTLTDTTPATGGSVINWWDTIDDYNSGSTSPLLPVSTVAGWSASTNCGGIETTTGDDSVWKDTTTTGCQAGDECIMKDKISNLEWTGIPSSATGTVNLASSTVTLSSANIYMRVGMYVSGTGIPSGTKILSITDSTHFVMTQSATSSTSTTINFNKMKWNEANIYCDGLSWDAKSDWRLPTQKELIASNDHGIRATQNVNFVGDFASYFWSSSSKSDSTSIAWIVYLANGNSAHDFKTFTYSVLCVRP